MCEGKQNSGGNKEEAPLDSSGKLQMLARIRQMMTRGDFDKGASLINF